MTKKLPHSMGFDLQGLPDKPLTWVGSKCWPEIALGTCFVCQQAMESHPKRTTPKG